MSRRNLVYAALVVASVVVSACAQPTAPAGTDTIMCRGGIIVGNGNQCPPE
jgi:predicted small secreted protein